MARRKVTVESLHAELGQLIEAGHGDVLVLTENLNPPNLTVIDRAAQYVGPSEWDRKTYRLDAPGSGVTIRL